jgi:hypothetical protein
MIRAALRAKARAQRAISAASASRAAAAGGCEVPHGAEVVAEPAWPVATNGSGARSQSTVRSIAVGARWCAVSACLSGAAVTPDAGRRTGADRAVVAATLLVLGRTDATLVAGVGLAVTPGSPCATGRWGTVATGTAVRGADSSPGGETRTGGAGGDAAGGIEGAGCGSGSGAGGSLDAGGVPSGGRYCSGSRYPCGSALNRMPKCTYGTGNSGTPLLPASATLAPSSTCMPSPTRTDPRWSSVAEYPSVLSIVIVRPPLGTLPAKETVPAIGASTGAPSAPSTSMPRCWPGVSGNSGSNANGRRTGPGSGHVQARAAPATTSAAAARTQVRRRFRCQICKPTATVPGRSVVVKSAYSEAR